MNDFQNGKYVFTITGGGWAYYRDMKEQSNKMIAFVKEQCL